MIFKSIMRSAVMLSILFLIVLVDAQGSNFARTMIKPGSCPPPFPVAVCKLSCDSDIQCAGTAKCCRSQCGGSACTDPVTESRTGVHAGFCPVKPTGPWVCTNRCRSDADCPKRRKCCRNRCGATACMAPEIEPAY